MDKKRKKEIAVVDSNLDHRNLISTFFKFKNFDITFYNSHLEAISASFLSGIKWDVMLVNLNFENISTAEFSKKIKKNLPLLPLIFIPIIDLKEVSNEMINDKINTSNQKIINFVKLQVEIDQALQIKKNISDNSKEEDISNSVLEKNESLIGRSPKFLAAVDIAKRSSRSTASILLTGESGTGKEVFANFIHQNSRQFKGPFVAIRSFPEKSDLKS